MFDARPQLRAFLAALDYLFAFSVGFSMKPEDPKKISNLVVATDSGYVATNATNLCKHWERNDWKGVDNRDLWKLFL